MADKRARMTIEVGGIAESGVPSTEIEPPPAPASESAPPAPALEPDVTVDSWGRGRRDPLVVAFVRDTKRERTVKRTVSRWQALFDEWRSLPR